MEQLYREYQLKFYLNGQHFIMIDGKRGEVHPHTWEFVLDILIGNGEFVQYHKFESIIEQRLSPYQNKVLNEVPPFRTIMPTLENQVEYFAKTFADEISHVGGVLIRMSGSESPTRSYVVDLRHENQLAIQTVRKNAMDTTIDSVLDGLLDEE